MMIKLYTTLGCHLCEQALAQLQALQAAGHSLQITEVEIADSEDLMEKYGIRIPVIAHGTDEIGWPFSKNELSHFLHLSQ